MTRNLLVAFILIFFITTNCSRIKKSIDNVDQSISFEGESYSLSRGTIESRGLTSDNEHQLIIRLMSNTLYYTDNLGAGTLIEIHLNSSTPDLNANKTYSLSNGSSSISKVSFYPLFNFTNTYNEEKTASSGSMIVTKVGNEYTIDFTFYSPDGDEIVGNYMGELSEISRTGYFMVGSETIDIKSGYIDYYGSSGNNSYNYDITLISLDEDASEETGKFSAVYFEMWSNSPNQLSNGIYTYDELETLQSYTFSYAEYLINYDMDFDYSGEQATFSEGNVNIQENNGIYSITIAGSDTNGKKIEGYYQGKLLFYDETYKKAVRPKLVLPTGRN